MVDTSYRSFRFIHPEWQLGPGSPGMQVTPTGTLAMVEDHQAVRQSIRMILSTAPGERVMRPDYGCRVHWLVFAPNDDTTAGLAIHYVTQAVRRWEPRIDLLEVDAEQHQQDPGILTMRIQYRLKATQDLAELRWDFELGGP